MPRTSGRVHGRGGVRLLLVAGLLLSGAAAVPLADAASPAQRAKPGTTYDVSMKSFAFSPASITVHVGDTVRWVYAETANDYGCESPAFRNPALNCKGHSVTSSASQNGQPVFDSGVHRAEGFPFSVRFTRPGTYDYFCTEHGGAHSNNGSLTAMNGQVTVQPR